MLRVALGKTDLAAGSITSRPPVVRTVFEEHAGDCYLKKYIFMCPYVDLIPCIRDLIEAARWARITLQICGFHVELFNKDTGETLKATEFDLVDLVPGAHFIRRFSSATVLDKETGETFTSTEYDWEAEAHIVSKFSSAMDEKLNRIEVEIEEEPSNRTLCVWISKVGQLVLIELLRKLEVLPKDCIWRNKYRKVLRSHYVAMAPYNPEKSDEENDRRMRNGLVTLVEADLECIQLLALATLETSIHSDLFIDPEFTLLEQDFEILQAMLELSAIDVFIPAAQILNRAGRPTNAKRVFVRILENDCVKSSKHGYKLTSLGLAAITKRLDRR